MKKSLGLKIEVTELKQKIRSLMNSKTANQPLILEASDLKLLSSRNSSRATSPSMNKTTTPSANGKTSPILRKFVLMSLDGCSSV